MRAAPDSAACPEIPLHLGETLKKIWPTGIPASSIPSDKYWKKGALSALAQVYQQPSEWDSLQTLMKWVDAGARVRWED